MTISPRRIWRVSEAGLGVCPAQTLPTCSKMEACLHRHPTIYPWTTRFRMRAQISTLDVSSIRICYTFRVNLGTLLVTWRTNKVPDPEWWRHTRERICTRWVRSGLTSTGSTLSRFWRWIKDSRCSWLSHSPGVVLLSNVSPSPEKTITRLDDITYRTRRLFKPRLLIPTFTMDLNWPAILERAELVNLTISLYALFWLEASIVKFAASVWVPRGLNKSLAT